MPRLTSALVAFALVMAGACVVNFVAQILLILLDVLTRLESSSAAILALWFVTGVFTTVFAAGGLDDPPGNGRFRATVFLWLSALAVVASAVAAGSGFPGGDPLEFSLMFTNVWVVIAFFVGAGAMAWVLRLATAPPAPAGRR